ncbi:hypothetical protein GOODEAATRI_021075 [Goodea atripinnis]|uniref:Uncharacterized protein n=1 Tax=Goodea atripinnis TaxID=208336 RepID=A0ABV0PQE4_9TELE
MANTKLNNSPNSNLKSLQNIMHEIEYLRSSREQQMEETMLCNHRLEQELWSCKETIAALEESNRALNREQVSMRRKVEEARQALLSGLGKVKELESKANHVPALQRHVLQLESELLYYRKDLLCRLVCEYKEMSGTLRPLLCSNTMWWIGWLAQSLMTSLLIMRHSTTVPSSTRFPLIT